MFASLVQIISSIDIKTTQKKFDIINIDRYTGIHVEEIK